MDFIYKQNNIALALDLIYKAFDSALKLTAELCAGNKRSKIKQIDLFIRKAGGNFSFCDFNGKALCNSGFADARLTDQAGIVFCSAAKDLNGAGNLFFPADNGIDLSFFSLGGQILESVLSSFAPFSKRLLKGRVWAPSIFS